MATVKSKHVLCRAHALRICVKISLPLPNGVGSTTGMSMEPPLAQPLVRLPYQPSNYEANTLVSQFGCATSSTSSTTSAFPLAWNGEALGNTQFFNMIWLTAFSNYGFRMIHIIDFEWTYHTNFMKLSHVMATDDACWKYHELLWYLIFQ